MRNKLIIVDGYNLIHRDEVLKQLMERDIGLARQRLIRMMEGAIPRLASKVTVVFDGRGRTGGHSELESTSVAAVFSPASLSADTVIERMVAESEDSEKIMVVTSDRLEADAVSASGAETVSCAAFLDRLRTLGSPDRRAGQAQRPNRNLGRIGDRFPQ